MRSSSKKRKASPCRKVAKTNCTEPCKWASGKARSFCYLSTRSYARITAVSLHRLAEKIHPGKRLSASAAKALVDLLTRLLRHNVAIQRDARAHFTANMNILESFVFSDDSKVEYPGALNIAGASDRELRIVSLAAEHMIELVGNYADANDHTTIRKRDFDEVIDGYTEYAFILRY
jgi:hypothetical protein